MKRTILIFGGLSIAILLLFQLDKFSLRTAGSYNEIFIIFSGSLFILIGFLINRIVFGTGKNHKGRSLDRPYPSASRLSKQEFKVLTLMADGLSNHQIAAHLFISENTVKSHVSKVLAKLNAKRRTEAVKIGRDLDLI